MKKLLFLPILILMMITSVPNVFCQFGQDNDIVKIEIYKSSNNVHADSYLKFAVKAEVGESWHINSNKPNEDFLIATQITSGDQKFQIAKVEFPKADEINFGFSDKPVSVFEGEILIGGLIYIPKDLAEGTYKIPVSFRYQACNDQTCMPPNTIKSEIEINVVSAGTKIDELNPEIFSKLNLSQNEEVKKNDESSLASTLESSGLAISLLLIFLGGLALNLTPCVYPLIPITIGYFGGQSEGRTGKLFTLGILYVLGMALTYSVIGVVTSLSGAVFGTLLQNPIVIIFIAFVFIVLSLSQFGVYEFKLPDSWVMKAGGAKSGVFGAFFMGLTMGIVAAPCIGPFVIGLVTYVAAKGDPFYGFLMFFVMALGLGFPYLLLALFSGKIKKLPRAGDWMEGVKHVFGFLLLGMALYFAGPLIPKDINHYLLPVFGIGAAVYLLFFDKLANNIKGFRYFKVIFSVVIIAVSIYALWPVEKASPDWQKFSIEKYEKSIENHENMVVDFYADWCIPCKELDAVTFSNPDVVSKSKEFTMYKVDMTQTMSDETETLRNKFNILGMPTVLIIDSRGNEVKRLTGFVNAKEFLEILGTVN